MLNIMKKEFKSYMRSTAGYILIALTLFFSAIFMSAYNMYYGSTKLEYVLPGLSLAFAFFIPLFTMDAFAKDRRLGYDRLYNALPISHKDVILGKLLSLLCIFGINVAALALLPPVLSIWGEVNFVSAYLSLICFIVFGAAFIAMDLFFAAISKNKAIAALISYAAAIVLFILYVVPTGSTSGLWMSTALTLRFISPFSHLDKFLFGTFEPFSIVYLLCIALLFVFLTVRTYTRRSIKEYNTQKACFLKKFSLSATLAVILAVCLIGVGVLCSFVPIKYSSFDMSADKSLSLSDETEEFISGLEDDVEVYVINADASDKSFERKLKAMDSLSSHLNFHYGKDVDFVELLGTLGWDGSTLAPYTIVVVNEANERIQVIDHASLIYYEVPDYPDFGKMDQQTFTYYYQMVAQYANQDQTYLAMLQSFNNAKMYFCGEQMFTQCVDYVTTDVIPVPYYVTGLSDKTLDADELYGSVSGLGLELNEFNVSGATAVPEDANCLMIKAPERDLSESEAAVIANYLKNGGAMILLTNEKNLEMKNLMSLVNTYGVSAEKGLVAIDEVIEESETDEAEAETEAETDAEASEEAAEPDVEPYNKFLVSVALNSNHEMLYSMQGYGTALVNANSIKISESLEKTTTVTELLTTSELAYIDGVDNSAGEKVLGVAIEDETENGPTEIVWITGADAFEGDTLQMINIYVAGYSILWCGEDFVSELDGATPTLINTQGLTINPTLRLVIVLVSILVIPFAVILLGVLLNKKRNAAIKAALAVRAPKVAVQKTEANEAAMEIEAEETFEIEETGSEVEADTETDQNNN